MSGTRFTSAFAADLEGYLAFKQNMGCYGASRIWYLRQFDAWCAEHEPDRFRSGHRRRLGESPAGKLGPVPVVDVVHPRLRPVAAGHRP